MICSVCKTSKTIHGYYQNEPICGQCVSQLNETAENPLLLRRVD